METPQQICDRVMADLAPSVSAMLGISELEARRQLLGFAESAKARASKQTDDIYRQGEGDSLLSRAKSEPLIRAQVEKRRAEGVTDADTRWWWNMCAFERAMITQTDDLIRISYFEYLRKGKGWDAERAGHEVRKRHLVTGDFTKGQGEDRPLPVELKRRIVAYIERHYAGLPEAMKLKTDQASSFNALVRAASIGQKLVDCKLDAGCDQRPVVLDMPIQVQIDLVEDVAGHPSVLRVIRCLKARNQEAC